MPFLVWKSPLAEPKVKTSKLSPAAGTKPPNRETFNVPHNWA